jgi:hypothetical protein
MAVGVTAQVEVETVDEDCSKFLVWEFSCKFKVGSRLAGIY